MKALSPSLILHLDAVERGAVALLKGDSFDARELAARSGRVRFVSLLSNNAGSEIGWHVGLTQQTTATQLGQQGAALQRHGQGRHFDLFEQWTYGVRRFRTYERDFRGNWRESMSDRLYTPAVSCRCHDKNGRVIEAMVRG